MKTDIKLALVAGAVIAGLFGYAQYSSSQELEAAKSVVNSNIEALKVNDFKLSMIEVKRQINNEKWSNRFEEVKTSEIIAEFISRLDAGNISRETALSGLKEVGLDKVDLDNLNSVLSVFPDELIDSVIEYKHPYHYSLSAKLYAVG